MQHNTKTVADCVGRVVGGRSALREAKAVETASRLYSRCSKLRARRTLCIQVRIWTVLQVLERFHICRDTSALVGGCIYNGPRKRARRIGTLTAAQSLNERFAWGLFLEVVHERRTFVARRYRAGRVGACCRTNPTFDAH